MVKPVTPKNLHILKLDNAEQNSSKLSTGDKPETPISNQLAFNTDTALLPNPPTTTKLWRHRPQFRHSSLLHRTLIIG